MQRCSWITYLHQITFLPSLSLCLTICPRVGCSRNANKNQIQTIILKNQTTKGLKEKRIDLYWLKELINNILCTRNFRGYARRYLIWICKVSSARITRCLILPFRLPCLRCTWWSQQSPSKNNSNSKPCYSPNRSWIL